MAFEGEDARRWKLVKAPTLQPAVDFVTKSPNGPFIDTQFDVPFEVRGRVYLSVETIKEMAEVAGLLDSKNANEKNLHDIALFNEGYEAGLKEGQELNGKLDSIMRHLSGDVFSDVITNVAIDENESISAGESSGSSEGTSEDAPKATAGSRKPRGTSKPVDSVKGPNDVSSVNGNDATFGL